MMRKEDEAAEDEGSARPDETRRGAADPGSIPSNQTSSYICMLYMPKRDLDQHAFFFSLYAMSFFPLNLSVALPRWKMRGIS